MLKKLTIHGFKSIERQTIELGALNVLIGANGSGKSNLLSALSFFRASALGNLDAFVKQRGGADRLLFHGKKSTKSCFFSCEAESFSYEQTLIPVAGDRLAVAKEGLSILDSGVEWTEGGGDIGSLEQQLLLKNLVSQGDLSEGEAEAHINEFPSAKEHIEGWRMYHLHDTTATAAVKSTCNVDDNRYLREDAANLAAYLYWLKLKQPNEYRRIVSVIQLAIPYFEDFVLEPLRRNERSIRLEWKQRHSDAYFDADSLSDGSLRFVGLATLLNQPQWAMPRLIVIDEPELGLHPLAIRLLAEMLDAASEQTQILVATQSVTLLDNFPIEQVIVTDHDGRGSLFRRLNADDYRMWLEHFSTGELWEKNVFGGRP
ncbi:MAG: AAA family ATPase [Methylococcus sp.]